MAQKTVERMMRIHSHLSLRDSSKYCEEAAEWGLGIALEGPEDLDDFDDGDGESTQSDEDGLDHEAEADDNEAADEDDPPSMRRRVTGDGIELPSERTRIHFHLDEEDD